MPEEVKIIKNILEKHPRLLRLYNFSYAPSQTVLWFEFCAAGDLSDLIKAYHTNHGLDIPESFIWHVYIQLAEALAFIHTGYDRTDQRRPGWRPVVHRDVKPQNIFLRRPTSSHQYPDIVLADFGLATTRTRSGEGGVCGSLLWQGPEIPIHSRAGDCWAVGACIHAMATGSPPISAAPRGVASREWAEAPTARKVKDLTINGYSTYLDDALYKVMRTNPNDRLTGRGLVKRVERGYEDWGGRVEPLDSWALKN